jgi:hypothetical protein
MTLISKVVLDQHGRAIAAAQVEIRDDDGALVELDGGNPIITDGAGAWSVELDGGTYSLVISKGADFISREEVVCGGDQLVVRRAITTPSFGFMIDNDLRPAARIIDDSDEAVGAAAGLPSLDRDTRILTTCTFV